MFYIIIIYIFLIFQPLKMGRIYGILYILILKYVLHYNGRIFFDILIFKNYLTLRNFINFNLEMNFVL